MANENKRRGRPPLTDEQREERDLKRKAMAVKRQQKYVASHPEKIKMLRQSIYEPKIRVQIAYKDELLRLCKITGKSLTVLCLTALEEKYGVTLHKTIDNDSI